MFEPIHGSAPKYAGKNVANPLAAISAVQMMLEHIGEKEASKLVDNAISKALSSGKIKDLSTNSGLHTNEIGDIVVEYII
jgi:3-isopropylmalate dehydrogenase